MRRLLAGAAAILALGGTALAADAVPANKRLVIDFFNFNGTRAQRAEQMLTPDYVQHNPRFLAWEKIMGVHARDAWVQVLPDATAKRVRLVELGGISLRRPIIVMVDGDLVHAVYRGRLPDPQAPGKTYEAFAFEAFRLRDGRFAEHWDQVRLSPGWMIPSPTPLAPGQADDGPAPVPQPPADCKADPARMAANKALAMQIFDGPVTRRNIEARAALLAPDYIQHNPRFLKMNERNGLTGRAGWRKAIEDLVAAPPAAGPAPPPRKPDLLLADCDYVSIVWRQVAPDPDAPGKTYEVFTFDTFRLEDGLIAEHWDSAAP